jgi:hypothetical protein
MDSQSNRSQSGRLKRPTERFLSYIKDSAASSSSSRKRSKQSNHPTGINEDSLSLQTSSKKREYCCRHCGFTAVMKSPQDFIKRHHLMKDNRACFENAIVHCPNPNCGGVFLSANDMERHCTMKTLNNPCLQSYRKSKSLEIANTRHNSTQVNVSLGQSSLNIYGQNHLLEVGTLYNSNPPKTATPQIIGSRSGKKILPHPSLAKNFTSSTGMSQSHHHHNVLVNQGDFISSLSLSIEELPNAYNIDRSGKNIYHDSNTHEYSNLNDMDPHSFDAVDDDVNVGHLQDLAQVVRDHSRVLIEMKESMDSAARKRHFTMEQKACVALESMLRKANTPLYLYDEIMSWVYRSRSKLFYIEPMINRKSLYESLGRKIYGDLSPHMKPREIPLTLPSGRQCGVTVFNVYSQILSLLTREDINQWDNYFFSPKEDDFFHLNTFSDWETGFFDDIETSIWYQRTQAQDIHDPQHELLIPICLFIDSTVLSLSGSLSLEPIMFSIMIHNRETRQKPEAWLPLGYINDLSSIAGKKYKDGQQKLADYHAMLSVILEDLTHLVTSREGLEWTFRNVNGQSTSITKKLVFRLAFIIGDTKGHDMLCCRMGSHNWTPGLCRDCDMLTEFADDPSVPCTFLKQKDLSQKTVDELRDMSFYRVNNYPFDKLPFGASPYGVNGATAIDIIHAILIGLMEYLYQTFTDQLTAKQFFELSKYCSFIATYKSKGIPGFPNCGRFKKGLSTKGIITAKMRLARCFLVFLTLATKGFKKFLKNKKGKLPSSIQKKMKKEKKKEQEEMLESDCDDEISAETCLRDDNINHQPLEHNNIVLDNPDEEHYTDTSDDDDDDDDDADINSYVSCEDSTYDPNNDLDSREPIVFTDGVYNDWKNLFEHTLMFYGWLKSVNMPCFLFKHGSRSVANHCTQRFMELYRDTAYRFDGMGLKITKFHQVRH